MDPFKTIPQMCKCFGSQTGPYQAPQAIKDPLGFPTAAPAVDQRPGVFNKVFYSAPTTSVL